MNHYQCCDTRKVILPILYEANRNVIGSAKVGFVGLYYSTTRRIWIRFHIGITSDPAPVTPTDSLNIDWVCSPSVLINGE